MSAEDIVEVQAEKILSLLPMEDRHIVSSWMGSVEVREFNRGIRHGSLQLYGSNSLAGFITGAIGALLIGGVIGWTWYLQTVAELPACVPVGECPLSPDANGCWARGEWEVCPRE